MDKNMLINLLQNIESRLANLERNFNELSKRTAPNPIHLEIKNVQTLNLDELSYHLENIDVKELSGILNIGNIFPPHRNSIQSEGKKNKKTTSVSQNYRAINNEYEESEISVRIDGRSVPYRLINNQETNKTEKTLSSNFTIRDINIGTIEDASAVNFGNNFPTDFKSHKKVNQGFGNIFGNQNDIHDILAQLEEKDAVEVYYENQDQHPPEWVKRMEDEQKKEMI
ncbi:hypothetical protein [Peribacillus alkalitolerans]|uniref:hypothetical protein n=1 Tax=Peribacillus alkalitolerans TaxID=1550385 RepID=UPI0013D7B609|nr:hypothetical protein [Peribacillus alkalitolerans]